MRRLAQDVFDYIREQDLLRPGCRVAVGVSGGADSVALLRLLTELRQELGIVLSVAHLNHQLRGKDANEDERWVAALARQLHLPIYRHQEDVAAFAAETHSSLETAGRDRRYNFFRRLLLDGECDRVATAHTLDDQAETVLMRAVRGTGTRGMAGIYPRIVVEDETAAFPQEGNTHKSIIRPLLRSRRSTLEAYLKQSAQPWREDRSNRDLRFTRNRVRHGLMPRLERHLNAKVRESLADLAEIARAEEDFWCVQTEAALRCSARGDDSLSIAELLGLPLALQRRVLRNWFEESGVRLDFPHVEAVRALLSGSYAHVALPDNSMAVREKDEIRLRSGNEAIISNYQYALPIPGQMRISALGLEIEAELVPPNSNNLHSDVAAAAALTGPLTLRNWRPGDRFWPEHARAPKKVKELLQERRIAGARKKLWPVVLAGDALIWMPELGLARGVRLTDSEGPGVRLRVRQPR